jgi:hypothetical protein
MPPQQAYGLPDLVDKGLGFGAHDAFLLFGSEDSARNIGAGRSPVKDAPVLYQ